MLLCSLTSVISFGILAFDPNAAVPFSYYNLTDINDIESLLQLSENCWLPEKLSSKSSGLGTIGSLNISSRICSSFEAVIT